MAEFPTAIDKEDDDIEDEGEEVDPPFYDSIEEYLVQNQPRAESQNKAP